MSIKSVCYLGELDEVLFLYFTQERDEITTHFSIYASLNNIKKICESNEKKASEKKYDPYIGYVGVNLSLFSSYKNYAYVIRIIDLKIILTIDDSENKFTDDALREIFKKLHKIYVDAVCNPFYVGDLQTPSFLKKIKNLVETT